MAESAGLQSVTARLLVLAAALAAAAALVLVLDAVLDALDTPEDAYSLGWSPA